MEPEIKDRIIDVKSQMNILIYFYGVTILQLVLRQSDNFLTSCQGKEIVDMILETINLLRTEGKIELLLQKTVHQAEVLEIT